MANRAINQHAPVSTMQQIRDYFEHITPMTEDEWVFFSSRLIRESFPKKALLLEGGQVERYLSFVESGMLRFFLRRGAEDLEEMTYDFSFAGEFVSGYSSFITQSPARFNIEALTPVTLWRISFEALEQVYAHTRAGNRIGRYASEQLFLEKAGRELSFLTESAEERYLHLLTGQPQLIRQIPLKYLASYIGITPQALSRIRKRIS